MNSLNDSTKRPETASNWKVEPGLVEVEIDLSEDRKGPKGTKSPSYTTDTENNGFYAALACGVLIIVIVLTVGLIKPEGSGGDGGGGRSVVGFLRAGGGGGGGGSRSGSSSGRGGGGGGGRGGGGSCFPAGQAISMTTSERCVAIESLVPGTEIQDGGRVKALMKLRSSEALYRYNNSALVTGSHLVHEFGSWISVQDSHLAVPVPNNDPFVYNIISEEHAIVINSTLFSDWEEWDDTEENWKLEKSMLDLLNDDKVDHRLPKTLNDSEPVGEGAFASSTPILMADGTSKAVESVQPGDRLYDGSEVFSVMQLYIPPETAVYTYHGHSLTEWTVVYEHEEKLWRNVRFSPHAKPRTRQTPASSSWYQLWTTNHRVPVSGGLLFADYHIIDEDDPIFIAEL